ncbi:hypothetical protein [Methanoregula sp.]
MDSVNFPGQESATTSRGWRKDLSFALAKGSTQPGDHEASGMSR